VRGEGKVVFHSLLPRSDQLLSIVLHDVLWVPTMRYSIFSVRQAAARGAVTAFGDGKVLVKYKGSPVICGVIKNGMYVASTVSLEHYHRLLPVEANNHMSDEHSATMCLAQSFE
jgi:hypothetical protein